VFKRLRWVAQPVSAGIVISEIEARVPEVNAERRGPRRRREEVDMVTLGFG